EYNDNNENIVYTRYKISKKNDLGKNEYNFAVAFCNKEVQNNYFNIYFRTRHQNKFPFLMHGTFDLSEDRERIKETPNTVFIFKQLSELIVDIAIKKLKN